MIEPSVMKDLTTSAHQKNPWNMEERSKTPRRIFENPEKSNMQKALKSAIMPRTKSWRYRSSEGKLPERNLERWTHHRTYQKSRSDRKEQITCDDLQRASYNYQSVWSVSIGVQNEWQARRGDSKWTRSTTKDRQCKGHPNESRKIEVKRNNARERLDIYSTCDQRINTAVLIRSWWECHEWSQIFFRLMYSDVRLDDETILILFDFIITVILDNSRIKRS